MVFQGGDGAGAGLALEIDEVCCAPLCFPDLCTFVIFPDDCRECVLGVVDTCFSDPGTFTSRVLEEGTCKTW